MYFRSSSSNERTGNGLCRADFQNGEEDAVGGGTQYSRFGTE